MRPSFPPTRPHAARAGIHHNRTSAADFRKSPTAFNAPGRGRRAGHFHVGSLPGTEVRPPAIISTNQANSREETERPPWQCIRSIRRVRKLAALDPIGIASAAEAEDIVRREPELASFIYSTVLHHERLKIRWSIAIAERLDHSALSGDLIRQTYDEALRDEA